MAERKKASALPIIIFLVIAIGLGCSLWYGLSHADELGASPRGKIANVAGISLEQADIVLDVLEQCGVQTITSIEHDTLLDDMQGQGEKGYRIATEDAPNVMLYLLEDGSVYSIRYADKDLYSDGAVIAKLYNGLVIGVY